MSKLAIDRIDAAIDDLQRRSYIGTGTAIDILLDVRHDLYTERYSDSTKEGWLNKMEDMDEDTFALYQDALDEQEARLGPEPLKMES